MKKRLVWAMILGCVSGGLSERPAKADDVVTFVIKRQEEKKRTRWSLSDWLDTRDRMRMQDLWLALHSPSPYEFSIGGAYQYVFSAPNGPNHAWQASLAAYVTIFGLSGEWDAGWDASGEFVQRWLAQFNFRVFGMHMQGTNLTLHVAYRQQNEFGTAFRQPALGGSITLYIAKPVGLEGLFRYHLDSTPSSAGATVGGMRVEGGGFIEFKFLRIYGTYFWEPEWRNSGGTGTRTERQGVLVGGKLFL
jgi:hypothetical protein